jgi:hypothetical protein
MRVLTVMGLLALLAPGRLRLDAIGREPELRSLSPVFSGRQEVSQGFSCVSSAAFKPRANASTLPRPQ